MLTTSQIPVLQCFKREFGAVAADPFADAWASLEPVFLSETVSGLEPQQKTWVKAGWDDLHWRVLFYCEDTHIWATHTKRDAPLYEEEAVEVFVDASGVPGDPDSYFEMELNPLNTVMDLVLRKNRSGLKKDFSWQCEGLETAVQIWNAPATSSLANQASSSSLPPGWSAELSIPFASLGALPPAPEWRVNFYRIDRPLGAPRELSAWSPTGVGTFHQSNRFGFMQFSEGE